MTIAPFGYIFECPTSFAAALDGQKSLLNTSVSPEFMPRKKRIEHGPPKREPIRFEERSQSVSHLNTLEALYICRRKTEAFCL